MQNGGMNAEQLLFAEMAFSFVTVIIPGVQLAPGPFERVYKFIYLKISRL